MSEPLLREFLASNDHTCERCGYNLRNIGEPFCPECGYVIPRPGTDELEGAMVGTRPQHRLWCLHCQHDVKDVAGDLCPGCGKSLVMEVTRFDGRKPRTVFGVPVRLILSCLICMLFLIRPGLLLGGAIARSHNSEIAKLMLAIAVLAAPFVMLIVWWRVSERVRQQGEAAYWMLCIGVHVAAVLCVIAGTRMY
jgi:hypothetical protein